MRLKLPSKGEVNEHFHKAKFPKKAYLKSDHEKTSGKEIAELSVKATLFNEGTLKNLLKEKSCFPQLEQNFGAEEEDGFDDDDDDDFVLPKKPASFKSKRLQNKREKKDIEQVESQTEKKSKPDEEKKEESLENDGNIECESKEGEEKSEIEGWCNGEILTFNYLCHINITRVTIPHFLFTLSKACLLRYMEPVVPKLDSAIHWIVIFSPAAKRQKIQWH